MASSTTYYKGYSTEDKAAMKELKQYMEAKTGGEVTLADAIAAVEPSEPTPAHLVGC